MPQLARCCAPASSSAMWTRFSGGLAQRFGPALVISVRQTLRNTPPEYLLLDTWTMPALDDLDADQKRQFHVLNNAISYYVGGGNISRYLRDVGIHQETFYRAFNRC